MRIDVPLRLLAAAIVGFLAARAPFVAAAEPFVLKFGPQGDTEHSEQIRVQFARPLIALESLDSTRRDKVLSNFSLTPAVPGKYRLLGTDTVVYETESDYWAATTCRVRISGNLEDLDGLRLGEDLSWQFRTAAPRVSVELHRGVGSRFVGRDGPVYLRSDLALDLESVRSHTRFTHAATGRNIPVRVTDDPENKRNPSGPSAERKGWWYVVVPEESLVGDDGFVVTFEPGIMPRWGDRATGERSSATFRTPPPFRFREIRFAEVQPGAIKTPWLVFSTEADLEQFQKLVRSEPGPIKVGKDRLPFAVPPGVELEPASLRPLTRYRVVIPSGLKDVYGQEIENPQTLEFTTSRGMPRYEIPHRFQLLSPLSSPTISLTAENVDLVKISVAELQPKLVLVREQGSGAMPYPYFGDPELRRTLLESPHARTVQVPPASDGKVPVNVAEYLGADGYGLLKYGLDSSWATYEGPQLGMVNRTDLGVFVHVTVASGVVRVNRLSTGAAVQGAKVSLFPAWRSEKASGLPPIRRIISGQEEGAVPCFAGTTDARGILEFGPDAAMACERPDSRAPRRLGFRDEPQLAVLVQEGEDWTLVGTSTRNSSLYEQGMLPPGILYDKKWHRPLWDSPWPMPRGTIFSDRMLYRPGETVRMKGISRFLHDGKLHAEPGARYTLTLVYPYANREHRNDSLGTVELSAFGTFHVAIPTTPEMPLGTYRLEARSPREGLVFFGHFELAEARPPVFRVAADATPKSVSPGDRVRVSWSAEDYGGAALAGAPVSISIYRRRGKLRDETQLGARWPGFRFPEQDPPRPSFERATALSEKRKLDADGKGFLEWTVEDIEYTEEYVVSVSVTDPTGKTLEAKTSFAGNVSRPLIGFKLLNYFEQSIIDFPPRILVTDTAGNPIAGEEIAVCLREGMDSFSWDHLKPALQCVKVVSAAEPVVVPLDLPPPGTYGVTAQMANSREMIRAHEGFSWRKGVSPWAGGPLDLILDKESYEVGDEAILTIRSPFPKAEAFVTVSRDSIFLSRVQALSGTSAEMRIPVTEEMLPNAFVAVHLVNQGEVPKGEPVNGGHLYRTGFMELEVSTAARRLSVDVMPSQSQALPGDEIAVSLEVKDPRGRGHRSEIAIMAVDEAILALTDYRPPDLVALAYAPQELSARFADNRYWLYGQTGHHGGRTCEACHIPHKAAGGGGDPGPSRPPKTFTTPVPKLRVEFLKVVHYDPALMTDANGRAAISFRLPDNITTWRIFAVAVGEDPQLFGNGEAAVVAAPGFLLRPLAPALLRNGDVWNAAVQVVRTGGCKGSALVRADLPAASGCLEPIGNEPLEKRVAITAGEESPIASFALRARRAGACRIRFTAVFDDAMGAAETADAVEVVLPVLADGGTESVVAVGETHDRIELPLKVDEAADPSTGGLEITLSSSDLLDLGAAAKRLGEVPFDCLERVAGRALALIELHSLSERYGFTLLDAAGVDSRIAADLERLYALQVPDGGFRFWPSDTATYWTLSPYVARLFRRCRELGIPLRRDVVDRFVEHLRRAVTSPVVRSTPWAALRLRRALADMDLPFIQGLTELFERRAELDLHSRIDLAGLLARHQDSRGMAERMLAEIEERFFLTVRSAHPAGNFAGSATTTTAAALEVWLAVAPGDPFVRKLVTYLLESRVNGSWTQSYETAMAVDALFESAHRREATSPSFAARVDVRGKRVMEARFEGRDTALVTKTVPMQDLPRGDSTIGISKEGSGTVRWTVELSSRRPGPRPARSEGLRISRTVFDADGGVLLASSSEQAPVELRLAPGRVVMVEIEFALSQSVRHLVVTDPLPAGLEPIDPKLATTPARYRGQSRLWRKGEEGWGLAAAHFELHDERVLAAFTEAERGTYRLRYLARVGAEGVFVWPGAEVGPLYEPEQFGRTADWVCIVRKVAQIR